MLKIKIQHCKREKMKIRIVRHEKQVKQKVQMNQLNENQTARYEPDLAGVDVNADGNEEDGDEDEVDDCVDEYRNTTRLHTSELDDFGPPRKLKQQSGAQQHEQQQSHHHRPPICHLSTFATCS